MAACLGVFGNWWPLFGDGIHTPGAGQPVTAGNRADIAVLLQFRIHPGVAAGNAPVVGDAAGDADFHTVDFLLADVLGSAGVGDGAGVVHHRVESGLQRSGSRR